MDAQAAEPRASRGARRAGGPGGQDDGQGARPAVPDPGEVAQALRPSSRGRPERPWPRAQETPGSTLRPPASSTTVSDQVATAPAPAPDTGRDDRGRHAIEPAGRDVEEPDQLRRPRRHSTSACRRDPAGAITSPMVRARGRTGGIRRGPALRRGHLSDVPPSPSRRTAGRRPSCRSVGFLRPR